MGNKPVILHIETGGDNCSVAISQGEQLIGLKESEGVRDHAKLLSVFIDDVLKENKLDYKALNAISISKGPGSYTGLRIGVATAKGLCYGLNIPLIATDSLVAHTYLTDINVGEIYCPMIDARRMEVYTALFNSKRERLTETKAVILDENSLSEELASQKIIFIGSGAKKFVDFINNNNAVLSSELTSAKGLIIPALNAYNNKQFEDIAYFEPFYLKDFVVTTKKKF